MIGGVQAQQRNPFPSSARLCRSLISPQLVQGSRRAEHCRQAARAVPGRRHGRRWPQIVQVSMLAFLEHYWQMALPVPRNRQGSWWPQTVQMSCWDWVLQVEQNGPSALR